MIILTTRAIANIGINVIINIFMKQAQELSGLVRNYRDWSVMIRTGQEWSGLVKNYQDWSRINRTGQGGSGLVRND